MGKVHGSLARAGKVRGQTPKVAKQDKKKKPRGRAHKRMQYNRRFVTAESKIVAIKHYSGYWGLFDLVI
uniref:40S ribosomal protein S30 n=1 Tax=Solanum lycopersicum TaxID=4081 RepID=A0A3Q7IMP3_SOLLC